MKKIIYYLTALLFISVEFIFCQPDVCQSQLIPEEHKLFKVLLSIVEDIKAAKANSENLNLKDYLLESGKNSDTTEAIISELPPLFEEKLFYEITITPLAANVKAETGEVSCKMILTNEDGSNSEYFLLVKFVKQLNTWILADNEYNHRFLSFLDDKYTPQQLDAITTFTVRESDKTLIRYRIKSDPEIWELNKNVTWSYMERWLFANQSPIDVDVYQFENNWPYTTAAFYLDPYWHRIVYSKYNSSDIKAFDIEFYQGAQAPSEPYGITIDDWGKIYVADKRNNCLIKLVYIHSANSVYFSSKLDIPGLDRPTDVVYSSHTTPKNATDDYLLIANKQARNIIKTSLSGTVLNTVTRFKTGGVYYNFISPSRITQVPGTTYIAVIDDALNYLIVGTIQESNTLVCHNVIKFNGTHHKYCVMRVRNNQDDPEFTEERFLKALDDSKFCYGHLQMLLNADWW